MKTIFLLARHFVSQLLRQGYWLWRLSCSSLGKNIVIHFPLRLEGSGYLSVGDECVIQRDVTIGCALGSEICFGTKSILEEGAVIRTSQNAKLDLGIGCSLGARAVLQLNGEWSIGDGSHIASYCSVSARESGANGNLTIGTGSFIGDHTLIDLSDDLTIGNGVAIGPYSIIYTHDHDYSHGHPIAWKGEIKRQPIVIGDGAWVGAGVIILPGVTIGERAVIAAGSVVTRDVSPDSVVAGIPAKPFDPSRSVYRQVDV